MITLIALIVISMAAGLGVAYKEDAGIGLQVLT